jgi:hypothetical protein
MLSKAKHLAFSWSYEDEILRLSAQNGILTHSGEVKDLAFQSFTRTRSFGEVYPERVEGSQDDM